MKGKSDALTVEQKETVKKLWSWSRFNLQRAYKELLPLFWIICLTRFWSIYSWEVEIEIFNELIKFVCSAMFEKEISEGNRPIFVLSLHFFPILLNVDGNGVFGRIRFKINWQTLLFLWGRLRNSIKIIPKRVSSYLFIGDWICRWNFESFQPVGEDVFSI